MTLPPLPWLPDNALSLDRARLAFAIALAAWTEAWFADAPVTLSAITPDERPVSTPITVVRSDDGRSDVAMSARSKRLLFEAACAVDLAQQNLGQNDHALIDAMTEEIALDLLERLDLTREAGAVPDEAKMSLSFSLGGRELMTVHTPKSTIVAKLRAQIDKTQGPTSTLLSRLCAINSTPIMLEAVVGSGLLSLSELHALVPGDILLLDAEIEAGVGLRTASNSRVIARGKLGRDDQKPALYF